MKTTHHRFSNCQFQGRHSRLHVAVKGCICKTKRVGRFRLRCERKVRLGQVFVFIYSNTLRVHHLYPISEVCFVVQHLEITHLACSCRVYCNLSLHQGVCTKFFSHTSFFPRGQFQFERVCHVQQQSHNHHNSNSNTPAPHRCPQLHHQRMRRIIPMIRV